MEFEPKEKKAAKQASKPARSKASFGGLRNRLSRKSITSGSGEKLTKMVEEFEKIFENTKKIEETGLEIVVTPMSKSDYGDDYDVVVVSTQLTLEVGGENRNLALVVPIVIEDTSNMLTPRKIVVEQDIFYDAKSETYIVNAHNNRNTPSFYLPTEVLETNLATNIEEALDLDPDTRVNRLDGVMLPLYADIEEEGIIPEYAARALDPIIAQWFKLTTNETANVIDLCENNEIKTNFFPHVKGGKDLLGIHLDDTFTIQVSTSSIDAGKVSHAPNTRGVSEPLLEVNGVVTLLPTVIDEEINGRVKMVDKLVPLVLARDVFTASYILEDALLTIATLAAGVAGNKNWMKVLIETSNELRDPGLTLKSIGADPKPFNKKGISRAAKEDVLFANCTENAMVGIDLPEYSLMSGAFAVIQAAAAGSKTALKEIVITATRMTMDEKGDSYFSPDFPIDNILTSMELPNGYFKTGTDGTKHSLASIDTDYICANHFKYANAFIEAETSEDGMLALIGVYNDIGLENAVLTGIRRRILFTSEFLQELGKAFSACGYKLLMDNDQPYRKKRNKGFDRNRIRKFASGNASDTGMVSYRGNNGSSRRRRHGGTFINKRF